MKCIYCHNNIPDGMVSCSHCGRHVPVFEKFKIDKINWFLILSAIIQVLIFLIFIIRLFNGGIVRSYLNFGKYDNAVALINKYSFLQQNKSISENINSIISNLENDYLNEKITYEKAQENINKFSAISGNIYKSIIDEAERTISLAYKSKNNLALGDSALFNRKYDDAITYYKNFDKAFPKNDCDINGKIENVLKKISMDFENYANDRNYSLVLDIVADLKNNCVNEEIQENLHEWEKEYLFEWIQYKKEKYDYVSKEGVLPLSIRYDSVVDNSSCAGTVDLEFQLYIQENIELKNYKELLNKLDSDYNNICNYPDYLDSEIYNNYRIICASKLIEQARLEHNYTGYYGAIKLCDTINSYKKGSIDKNTVINEYISTEKAELIQRINNLRSSKGLSVFNYNSSLESVALEIIFGNEYEKNIFKSVMEEKGIPYTMFSAAWKKGSKNAEMIENSLNQKEDVKILTSAELTDIGIGMIYNENDETFSWVAIAIR